MPRRPRKDEPAPDWQIDLHGCSVRDALHRLRLGLQTCRYQRLSTLRVITGRGNSSPDRQAVLAPALMTWLETPEARAQGVRSHRMHSGGGAIEIELQVPGTSTRDL